jgi:hypothetical protein
MVKQKERTMNYPKEATTDALNTIVAISVRMNLPLLETLVEMKENLDDYTPAERMAFRITMAGFGELFAEVA